MKPWCIKAGFHPVSYWIIIREFKKLRLLLQQKRHIKIELWVWLSILRLFHVDHVVQNRRTALSVAWYQWFSRKGKEWKIYCCELALSSEPQIWKFHIVFWQTMSKHCTKEHAARAANYFSSFNQSNHWFVVLLLTLPSSNLKLPIIVMESLISKETVGMLQWGSEVHNFGVKHGDKG